MTFDPYQVETPGVISFSGGRSSGYLLWHILEAFGGELPRDVHVVFMNTGKECPESLEFVAECGERWGVRIRWLEYDPKAPSSTREVSFATANRDGEPFAELIRRKNFLPNPVARICTQYLKVKRMIAFMRDVCGYGEWTNVVGFRADEPRRVARMRSRNDSGKERFETVAPLHQTGVTKGAIVDWWAEQAFDLRLPNLYGITPAGNCNLCFLKSNDTLLNLMREKPEWADWWIKMERSVRPDKPEGALFRLDRPRYERLRELAKMREPLPWVEDNESMACFCTD